MEPESLNPSQKVVRKNAGNKGLVPAVLPAKRGRRSYKDEDTASAIGLNPVVSFFIKNIPFKANVLTFTPIVCLGSFQDSFLLSHFNSEKRSFRLQVLERRSWKIA